jgi:peptidylprolyl isomerase
MLIYAYISIGNFVDLVNKKFYDGMSMQKIEDLTVQTGKPGAEEGYIDPKTKEVRTIPLELFYKQDKEPTYGITSDDDNRATQAMALPFQGTFLFMYMY